MSDSATGDLAVGDSALRDSVVNSSAVGDSALRDSVVNSSAVSDSALGDSARSGSLVAEPAPKAFTIRADFRGPPEEAEVAVAAIIDALYDAASVARFDVDITSEKRSAGESDPVVSVSVAGC